MSNQDSAKTVFLALSVNFFIGVIKSFVAVITSSSAMFSEAVHSFVDSFNQFLLWFGIKQSKKSNPKLYPIKKLTASENIALELVITAQKILLLQ